VRNPAWTFFARAFGFNKKDVKKDHIFKLLEDTYTQHNCPPNRVYNIDEAGLTIIQNKIFSVVGLKGNRQIMLTSAKRDSLIIAIICMGAADQFVPPYIIFHGKI
jgi:hypothetical protein